MGVPPTQKYKGGIPTPLSKNREGDPLPPCPVQDRVPPPLFWINETPASYGVTSENPVAGPGREGGTPPTQKYERGYPTPLSKK
jgi:hypothetical protein